MVAVAITHNEDHEAAVRAALDPLRIDDLVQGRVVAVKPNDTWASKDDTTAVTRPDTLRAVLRYIKERGPRGLIVSGGAGAAETDEVFRLSGMMQVVEEEGAEFFDHNRPPFEEVPLDYGRDVEVTGPQRSVMVNPRIFEYETLVVVSLLKMHDTATVTLALKNIGMSFPAADYYGHPRGSYRRQHHFFDDTHSFIAAMGKRFPIDVAVTVGHPAMVATGPIGGHVVESGLVIASRDALAADVVGAKLLGFNLQGVRHLFEASKLGIGESEPSRMEFPELGLEDAIRLFTRAAYGRELTFSHA